MQLAQKIIIADDHPLFRAALRQAVTQAVSGVDIVEADSLAAVQEAVEQHGDADLVLLDQDPVTIDPDRLAGIRVSEVYKEGRPVDLG